MTMMQRINAGLCGLVSGEPSPQRQENQGDAAFFSYSGISLALFFPGGTDGPVFAFV